MPRNCPSCGRENADDVDFCESCGSYLRWEPTRAATPAVAPPAPQTPPAPAQPEQPAQPAAPPQQPAQPAPPPQQVQAPPPAQPAAPAPAQQPQPAQPQPAPQQPAQAQPPPPEPQPEAKPEPKKRRWGRKKAPKVPGIQGGGVQGPKVRGPRVSAPRVNVGPGGVRVQAPRVQAPRVQAPRVKAPRVKQPKVPTTPKGFMKAFKKMKLPGGAAAKGGGDSGAVSTGPVAPQPAETWHWDAVGQEGGRGKVVAVFLALVLLAAGGAAAAWYFLVRDDGGTEPAKAAATQLTPRQFVGRLEPLLVRSASDRARISTAVTAVAACTLDPGTAGAQVAQTVRGRRAVLRQVQRLRAPNAQTRRAAALLARSMSTSAAAGTNYGHWIAAANGACPKRTGPDYAKALAANVQAQSAKTAFARTYNPIARRFGRRTWTAGQF
jgi:zinc-ribbon domain